MPHFIITKFRIGYDYKLLAFIHTVYQINGQAVSTCKTLIVNYYFHFISERISRFI